jgi:hypothetical protein
MEGFKMAFHYSDEESYAKILQDAHNALINRFKRLDDSKNAQELERILYEIKITAKSLNKNQDPVSKELYQQYLELIQTASSIQNQNRGKGTQLRKLSANTLFRREHGTQVSSSADDIFEEDLAAVLTAASQLNNKNSKINMEMFLLGSKSAKLKSLKNINLENEYEDTVIEIINKMAEKSGSRAKVQNLNVATGKIDIKGFSQSLEISKDLPFNISRLMELMKDATFSLKNYKSFKNGTFIDPEEIGLHLGNTNLYKAITGTLSEIGVGYKQQNSFFYRGAYTYLGNKHGLENQVATHFGHMRLIYELRGSGLLDESGHVLPVKYLIYNDPNSDAIYVKDTASLLKDLLMSSSTNYKLFGGIILQSGKIKSKT